MSTDPEPQSDLATYPPAVSSAAYPPVPVSTDPISSNQVQVSTVDFTVEVEDTDVEQQPLHRNARLNPPVSDPISLLATTPLTYSPFIKAQICSRLMLPCLSTGKYTLDLPSNSHILTRLVSLNDLQDFCDLCSEEIHSLCGWVKSI